MSRSLLKDRAKRIQAIQVRDQLTEGMYRVSEGVTYRWYVIWIEFYPDERWMVKEVLGPVSPEEIEGTRCRLDDGLKQKLESWV